MLKMLMLVMLMEMWVEKVGKWLKDTVLERNPYVLYFDRRLLYHRHLLHFYFYDQRNVNVNFFLACPHSIWSSCRTARRQTTGSERLPEFQTRRKDLFHVFFSFVDVSLWWYHFLPF